MKRAVPAPIPALILVLTLLLTAGAAGAASTRDDDSFSVSGRLNLRGVHALDPDSIREDPSFTTRVEIDGRRSGWHLHSRIEGGWDGTVRSPQRDHSLFKSFDEVYQDNTPYLDLKELTLERSIASVDVKVGVQRFAWGRLDEYPVNDLFNPWDYSQFILKPLEERKIGVPSVSWGTSSTDWTLQGVWVPWLVPYRLPKLNERWSPVVVGTALSDTSSAEVIPQEPDLPAKTLGNGSAGLRIQKMGDIEWAVNLFHGFDPRPVFKTTSLRVEDSGGKLIIDPGFVPSFHKITSIGVDGATVKGRWSLRAEAAYGFHRAFNVRQELWGYPEVLTSGVTDLNPIEVERNTLDYGIAGDIRPFEDAMLTLQAQQTVIFDRPDTLFDKSIETILWANLTVGWMNRKIETSVNFAYNPEHGATLVRTSAFYIFTDSWKAGLNTAFLDGPSQSLFGRFTGNDQVEMVVVLSW